MEFSIRHRIKGRIRLHIPALDRATPTAEQLLAWLRRQDGLHEVRVNYECASLVVTYDESKRMLLDLMLTCWQAHH